SHSLAPCWAAASSVEDNRLQTILRLQGFEARKGRLCPWWRRCVAVIHGLKHLLEKLLDPCRRVSHQHLQRLLSSIPEGVHRLARDMNKIPCRGLYRVVAHLERDFAFQDIELFFFAMVNMGWGTTPGRHQGKHGKVAAARPIARDEEGILV